MTMCPDPTDPTEPTEPTAPHFPASQRSGMDTDDGGMAYWAEPRHSSVNDAAACRQQDLDIADCVAMVVSGLTKPWVVKTQTMATWMGQNAPPILLEVGWLAWQLGACNTVSAAAGEYRLTTGRGSAYYISVGTQKIIVPDREQRDILYRTLRASHESYALRARSALLPKIAKCPERELILADGVTGVCCGQTAFFLDTDEQLDQLATMLNAEHKSIIAPAFDQMKANLKRIALMKV